MWKFDPASSSWTWVTGTNKVNESPQHSWSGVAEDDFTPGSRVECASWTGTDGSMWLFGGIYGRSYPEGCFNDLWKFDPKSKRWAWIRGSNNRDDPGVYGTPGIPSVNNNPCARCGATTWRDNAGDFWLFGGTRSARFTTETLNDLWKFDPMINQWTLIRGSNQTGQPGVYGTMGVPDPGNTPGGRQMALGWTRPDGTLWLFGGSGSDENSLFQWNDLWKFDPSDGNWTWIKGSRESDKPSTIGKPGLPGSDDVPSARGAAAGWTEPSGALLLFGGLGKDYYATNDLWELTFHAGAADWQLFQ
jgi:hypothetical protein